MSDISTVIYQTPTGAGGFRRERFRQRNPCRMSQLHLVVMLLLATASAFPQFTHFSTFSLADEPQGSNSKCTPENGVTSCVCDTSDSSLLPKKFEATISADRPKLRLLCEAQMTCTPVELNKSMVCPADTKDLNQCKLTSEGEGTACIPMKNLLSGDNGKVQWTTEEAKSVSKPYIVLNVPPENLPFSNKQFTVGCLNNSIAQCHVTVTIQARKTVMQERKVMCAYGKDSNNSKQHQTITLTPSQNSFTLVCGADGDVLPTDYNSHYCPVTETPTDAQASCSGNYESIFPAYNSNWWKPSEPKSFTFEVPADQFPEKDATISLGCRQKPSGDVNGHKTVSDVAETSVCNVDVTIGGTGAASTSPPSAAPGDANVCFRATAVAAALASLNQWL
ncbi:SAG-related sequence [Besnoitia besnoiti]|uniref:SAG-related sequence n=1 Tax=Besnoitia besnoiti TaxID=94643 RepID=A0A2A9MKL8_BESBE|nr:SAG-related sequence [Besnoitia besnoiti]PFH36831.1 SAG-related sequence [Besnoitia besnoiti]